MRKPLVISIALAIAAVGFGASSAKADNTCPNTFNICMDFGLAFDGSMWTLTTTYVTSPSGGLTATGIYYNAGSTAPDFGIDDVTLVDPATGWQAGRPGCNDLNMFNGTTELLGACGSTTNGMNDAVYPPGGTVVITFTADPAFATAFAAEEIDYRAHVQGYGQTSCSIKLDTGVEGNIGSSGTNCVPPTTVPEPISMILLGSGLLGIGGVRMRRRKK